MPKKSTNTIESESAKQKTSDIVIVGGGLAGLSMAAALSTLPLNITIVEFTSSPLSESALSLNTIPDKADKELIYSPSFDDRALALSVASIRILKTIGVFKQADIDSLTAIEHIHVSDRGHFGMLRMSAQDVDEEYLGRVVPAPLLGEKLIKFLSNKSYAATINILDQSQVTKIQHMSDKAVVSVSSSSMSSADGSENDASNTESSNEQQTVIDCQVVILADGGRSNMAEKIGLPARTTDYEQVGILANVVVNQSHQHIAYERFTDTGPLALLPLRKNEFKLVWTVEPSAQETLLSMTDNDFLLALQKRFGMRAGLFEKVSRRVAYPMVANERAQIVSGRVALIGNAAHSLHPIAGQGFNLGLRDVACLAEILAEQLSEQLSAQLAGNKTEKLDLGKPQALLSYQAARQEDIKRTATFTDQLVKGFSTKAKPVEILRTLGLLALDRQPMLKRQLIRKLMGVSGQQFKLLTGEALFVHQEADAVDKKSTNKETRAS